MIQYRLKQIAKIVVSLIIGALAGHFILIGFTFNDEGEPQVDLIIADTPTAIVEDEQGEYEIEVATVEEVDSEEVIGEDEEYGLGSYLPTTTPWAFRDASLGQCEDTDLHFGAQCYDLADSFWQNAVNRRLSTCGTGAAKGTIVDGCWQKNAGQDFDMVWNPEDLKVGDIVVFTNGQYGHIGMAMGSYHDGYITLLGQNQGGTSCSGGGSAANIINISTKYFGGAFRYKAWIEDNESTPSQITPSCDRIEVKFGDTMSSIMQRCEGTVDWSKMDSYAQSFVSTKVKPGETVYAGWHSNSGVGLYAGDVIERIK